MFCSPPVAGLWFGTDASGGQASGDPRCCMVAWAVIADEWCAKAEQFHVRGTLSGVLGNGFSIAQGEACALAKLLEYTQDEVLVAVDSKAAIRQSKFAKLSRSCLHSWGAQWEERRRLTTVWTRSHRSLDQFVAEFGRSNLWAWFANQRADVLCGSRAEECLSRAHVEKVKRLDAAAAQWQQALGRRAQFIFGHDEVHPCAPPKDASKRGKKKERPARNVRNTIAKLPVKQTPLNKKMRLQQAAEGKESGHTWAFKPHPTNSSIQCEVCGLYAQQVHPVATLDRIIATPCINLGAGGEVFTRFWDCHPSHRMVSLGKVWKCEKCHGQQQPGQDSISKILGVECKGASRVKGSTKLVPVPKSQCLLSFQAVSPNVSSAAVATGKVAGSCRGVAQQPSSTLRRKPSLRRTPPPKAVATGPRRPSQEGLLRPPPPKAVPKTSPRKGAHEGQTASFGAMRHREKLEALNRKRAEEGRPPLTAEVGQAQKPAAGPSDPAR